MVRTQLQIDDDTYEALREVAHKQRRSMSAVAREILREDLVEQRGKKAALMEDSSFIGSGASSEPAVSRSKRVSALGICADIPDFGTEEFHKSKQEKKVSR